MDSLVAVDVRSWFLKELAVDVPVLKILNGGSARALLEFAQELLPKSLTPNLVSSGSSEAPVVPAVVPPRAASPSEKGLEAQEGGATDEQASTLSTNTPSAAPSVRTDDNFAEVGPDSDTSLSESTHSSENGIQRVVPMSFGQSRFWFLKFYLEDQTAFNITSLIRISGPLLVDNFAKAVQTVGNRHEALRTSFTVEDNQPVQKIWSSPMLKLEHRDIASELEVNEAYEAIKNHIYDLEHGQTMRVQLLSRSLTEHFLVLGYHHINMDGISFEILFSDLEKAYYGAPFTADVIQYPDFSQREAQEYQTGKWASELEFWRSEFPDVPEPMPLLPLSKNIARPTSVKYGTITVKRRVSPELSAKIKETCRKFKATPFHFHLSVFKAVLARYIDSKDVCIGVADANRKDSDVMEAIGLFLNLLPLRVRAKPMETFGDTLKEMQLKSHRVFSNSRVPFDVLLNELNVPRSSAYAPLFQVFMNYRQGIDEVRSFCGCSCEGELIAGGQIAYDISLDVVDNPSGDALVMLAVQKDLYDAVDAETLIDNYFNLLDAFSKNPAARLNRPAIHDAVAVQRALQLGAGPAYEYTWPATVLHRIDDMVRKYPNNVALKNGGTSSITYAEMATRIDAIAAELQNSHLGGIIGVFQSPTVDFVCSILAIWVVGATYVPLEPRLGTSRLAAIAQESRPSCILVDPTTRAAFGELAISVPWVDVSAISTRPVDNMPVKPIATTSAAAVLYTSGSTGTPKGITLSHGSFRNNIEVATRQFDIQEGSDVVLQQAAFSFDMSLSQTLLGLCNGGTLVVVPKELRGDAAGLAQLIAAENVTVSQATPSEYMAWIHSGASDLHKSVWRIAASGGEKATEALAEGFRSLQKPDLRLFNGYGPTEITFTSNSRELPYNQAGCSDIPLLTWPNYAVYIVDQDFKPLPIGVPGEVCIGGAGVGLGYLNNKALTAGSFMRDNYAPPHFAAHGWTTMHRTGDHGRLCSDGGLLLKGRVVGDTQIKLRGLRIDLQDIEAAIVQGSSGKITQAAVSVRQEEESAPQFLVAHVVLAQDGLFEDEEAFLVQLNAQLPLPLYMKPSAIVPVAQLPFSSSNKLDRRKLLTLPVVRPRIEHTDHNLTTIQAEIKDLWNEVIPGDIAGNYDIGPTTDFFHVGGTSLLLVNLQGLLKKKYNTSPPLHKLFESSTLSQMAAMFSETSTPATRNIDWEQEAAIPSSMIETLSAHSAGPQPLTPPRVAVLTGATGFLGKHLLQFLLKSPSITEIHCITIRAPLSTLPALFTSSPKIHLHAGDLLSPSLGLSAAMTHAIFSTADVIIHNGADVSFMKTYATLSRTNVHSTRALAALAAPRRIPLHFISSASVTQLTGADEALEVSVAAHPPISSAKTTNGYTAAKWVCERFLEHAASRFGLPIVVHRPSSIMGAGADALDLMSNLFRYTEVLEAVPESRAWKGWFDFVSVQSVAAGVVEAVREGGLEPGRVRYLFESGEIEYPLAVVREMSEAAGEKGGVMPVRTVPLEEWVDGAEKAGLDPMLAAYLRGADEAGAPFAFPRLVKSRRS